MLSNRTSVRHDGRVLATSSFPAMDLLEPRLLLSGQVQDITPATISPVWFQRLLPAESAQAGDRWIVRLSRDALSDIHNVPDALFLQEVHADTIIRVGIEGGSEA